MNLAGLASPVVDPELCRRASTWLEKMARTTPFRCWTLFTPHYHHVISRFIFPHPPVTGDAPGSFRRDTAQLIGVPVNRIGQVGYIAC